MKEQGQVIIILFGLRVIYHLEAIKFIPKSRKAVPQDQGSGRIMDLEHPLP